MEFSMDLTMILFIALIIIFFIIPLLVFIIKSAVKQGILEAYKIIKNDKDNIHYFQKLVFQLIRTTEYMRIVLGETTYTS